MNFSVIAGAATKTTTGVERGVDVDFTLTLNGEDIDGEVTLRPHEDGRPGYGSWGDAANWVDGAVLARIRGLDHHEYRQILLAIEDATSRVADAFTE
jgi:hypothetical protein